MSATCSEAEQLLPWFVNGTAAADDRMSLYRHLAECASCRQELAKALALHRRVNEALERLPVAEPDAGRQLAAGLVPPTAQRRADPVALTASAMRALGAPPAVTQSLDLLQRLASWRPSTNPIAPLIPTLAHATSIS